jgi:hypothetical protein
MNKIAVVLALMATPAPVLAKKPNPILYSLSENSAVKLECSEPGETLDCDLTYLYLSVPNPAEIEAKYATTNIDDLLSDKKHYSAQEWGAFRKQCANLSAVMSPRIPKTSTSGHLASEQMDWDQMAELCACKDWRCFLSKRLAQEKDSAISTCQVRGGLGGHYRFEKTGANTWTHIERVSGGCEFVTAFTIAYTPSEHGFDWKLTEVRLSRKADDDFCAKLEVNKPREFQWRAVGIVAPHCKRFEFSVL